MLLGFYCLAFELPSFVGNFGGLHTLPSTIETKNACYFPAALAARVWSPDIIFTHRSMHRARLCIQRMPLVETDRCLPMERWASQGQVLGAKHQLVATAEVSSPNGSMEKSEAIMGS